MKSIWQDVRHGARVLAKSPGFAAAAVVVVARGIGANTAIFSVVNAALLQPLPYKDPSRLVQIWHVPPAKSFPGMTEFSVSAANYVDWRARITSSKKPRFTPSLATTSPAVQIPNRFRLARWNRASSRSLA
jgi:hypothetical protein